MNKINENNNHFVIKKQQQEQKHVVTNNKISSTSAPGSSTSSILSSINNNTNNNSSNRVFYAKLVQFNNSINTNNNNGNERHLKSKLSQSPLKSSNVSIITTGLNKSMPKTITLSSNNSVGNSASSSSSSSSSSSTSSNNDCFAKIYENKTNTNNIDNKVDLDQESTNSTDFSSLEDNINNKEDDYDDDDDVYNNTNMIKEYDDIDLQSINKFKNISISNSNENRNTSTKLKKFSIDKSSNINENLDDKKLIFNKNNNNNGGNSKMPPWLTNPTTLNNTTNNHRKILTHVPFQSTSASALLLRKTPSPTNNNNNSNSNDESSKNKCFQYSLISTQISKAKPTHTNNSYSNNNSPSISSSISISTSSSTSSLSNANINNEINNSSNMDTTVKTISNKLYNNNNITDNIQNQNKLTAANSNKSTSSNLLLLKPSISTIKLNNNNETNSNNIIKSNHQYNNTSNTNKSNLFDSTLLTPLTPISHSLKQQQFSNLNNKNKLNSIITVDSISPPTLVSFDQFNKELNKKYMNSCSSGRPSLTNSTTTNVKSASTSYLLSKITSIASLTKNSNNNSQFSEQRKNTISSSNSSNSSSTNSSYLSNHHLNTNNNNNQTSPQNKIAKFFNNKNSNSSSQIIDPNGLSSTCSSPNNQSISSIQQNTTINSVNNNNKVLPSISSSTSSSSSIVLSQNKNTNMNNNRSTSRRTFKKRSQSIHSNLENKNKSELSSSSWLYNLNEDYWYTTMMITHNQTLNNNNNNNNEITKIRLNKIAIKYLTLIELKYLKQICFNKLQKVLDQFNNNGKSKKSTSNLLSSTSSNLNNMTSHINYSSNNTVKLNIPKDESMKSIKTKNISTTRSRSVDFRFFDDLKENYFFSIKKSNKDSINEQSKVFGQTLYKCILNDLQKKSTNNSNHLPFVNMSINNKKIDNLLIASKLDLDLLNKIISNTNSETQILKDKINNQNNSASDLLFSKRNSVLFEALDLKNVNTMIANMSNQQPQTNTISSSKSNILKRKSLQNKLPLLTSSQANSATLNSKSLANSQNFTIRSEGLVPNIVKSCCKHINDYGLDVVGIFRIDSSKKRIKEIKEMFDLGKEVSLNEQFNTNDVACLLKEYLRSLPEPLLTRELYSGFLATDKILDQCEKLEAIRYLICLLPVPNRDTLQVLLKLLDNVRSHAQPMSPQKSPSGSCGGNKMDSFNLAMVFGPNLLKNHRPSNSLNSNSTKMIDISFQNKSNLADDIDTVISVTKYLIENQNEIFEIDACLHNELIQTISQVLTPNEINAILTRKLVATIGITTLIENKTTTIDSDCSSGYDSSIRSAHQVDFIDSIKTMSNTLSNKHSRLSRTKLNKLTNNFTFNCASSTLKPINFINSPSQSPTRSMMMKRSPPSNNTTKLPTPNSFKNNFSNELYGNMSSHEEFLKSQQSNKLSNNNPGSISSSSLLLMINNKSLTNKSLNIDENNHHTYNNNNNNNRISTNTKSTKSCTNLNDNILNSVNLNVNFNQQNESNFIDSNTIQICSKFYDKSKFNIIGEQETLV